jgi:hypothetical protein
MLLDHQNRTQGHFGNFGEVGSNFIIALGLFATVGTF